MHPAPFPFKLPFRCIKLHGLDKGVTTTAATTKPLLVLDPFCGIGSTAIACKRLGVSFVGFEIGKHYLDYAIERIMKADSIHGSGAADNNHTATLDLFYSESGIQGAATEFPTRDGGEKEQK